MNTTLESTGSNGSTASPPLGIRDAPSSLSTVMSSMVSSLTQQQLAVQGYMVFEAQMTSQQSPEYLNEERYRQSYASVRAAYEDIPITWRLKERMKTVSVALVLCLNVGTDPPDMVKITPCARMECWFDPRTTSKSKAIETIGNNLQQQYERWQARAKYKQALDPTIEDVKKLCASLRRNAKTDRLLFHYNGHGVPRPTSAGEIWVFNKTYTQYIPLSIYDLRAWVGTPAIYVLDCSGAGVLLPHFLQTPVMPASSRTAGLGGLDGPPPPPPSGPPVPPSRPRSNSSAAHHRDCIVLAPCAANELLLINHKFPADLFTSCLTTPILVALRWFIAQNPLSMAEVDVEFVDHIPGKLNDRKTPLGELNWIFTAITDTIAWNTLPSTVFQYLFRQDLLVASLFRNFLLADRILRSFNCTPTSIPRLPSTAQHPLWQAWDLAAECCLHQLVVNRKPSLVSMSSAEARLVASASAGPGFYSTVTASTTNPSPFSSTSPPPGTSTSLSNAPTSVSSTTFFADQLTAFEVWIEYTTMAPTGAPPSKPPDQLPVVLQVLLSQAHRLRALLLLRRFLDLGPWAVNLALSVGIFPYVLKLLQSPAPELRQVLVCIWARILAFDPSCRSDLVKDNAYLYFIGHLSGADIRPEQRVLAAFIVSAIMDESRSGQRDCLKKGVHRTCAHFLFSKETEGMPEFRRWLCFCLGRLAFDYVEGKVACLREDIHLHLFGLLGSPHVAVRAAAVHTLGTFLGSGGGHPGGGAGRESGSGQGQGHNSSSSLSSMSSPTSEMGTLGSSPGGGRSPSTGRAASIDLEAARKTDVSVIGLPMLRAFDDVSPMVRRQAIFALFLLVTDSTHFPYFVWVAHELTRFNAEKQQQYPRESQIRGERKSGQTDGKGTMQKSRSCDSIASLDASSSTSSMVGLVLDEEAESQGRKEDRALGLSPSQQKERDGERTGSRNKNDRDQEARDKGQRLWCQALAARLKRKAGEIGEHYLLIWLAIRQVHQKEPFPPVADVAGQIVHLVHECLLDMNLNPSKNVAFPGASARPLRSTASAMTLSPMELQHRQEQASEEQPQPRHDHLHHEKREQNEIDAQQQQGRQESSLLASPGLSSTSHPPRVPPRPPHPSGIPPRSPPTSANPNASSSQKQQLRSRQQQQHTYRGHDGHYRLSSGKHVVNNLPTCPAPTHLSSSNRVPLERAVSAHELARLPTPQGDYARPPPTGLREAAGRSTASPYGGTNHLHAGLGNSTTTPSGPSDRPIPGGGVSTRPSAASSLLQSASGTGPGGNTLKGKGSGEVFEGGSYEARGLKQSKGGLMGRAEMPGSVPLIRHESLAAPDDSTAMGQASSARFSSATATALAESPSLQWLRVQYQRTNIYAWSKKQLSAPAALSAVEGPGGEEDDPLSPEGQVALYRRSRNQRVLEEAKALTLKCTGVLGMPEEEEDSDLYFMLGGIDALLAAQREGMDGAAGARKGNVKKTALTKSMGDTVKRKNQVLRLQQKVVFESDAQMTSQLLFHPFEPLLIASDDHANLRVWNHEDGKKLGVFRNEPIPSKASRITSLAWLNEATSSLLLTGTDEGVVRVWSGVVPTGADWVPPRLATAFFAHALVGRGFGVVTKWVHGAGLLLTGGSSDRLRAWDLEREQMVREWETGGEACVTCLAASTPHGGAGGRDSGGNGARGSQISSSPLVVAGFGDGKGKIWDVRVDKCVGVLTEHQQWLVLTDFVKGDRELLTGSLTGEVRAWDLRRLKTSLRTMDVGKGPMTAMAAHQTCPLLASGSYNQFIKMLTLEGDTLSVIRYHDGILGQRIGPVATLAFHPCKLVLAAGTTDSLTSIYTAHFPQAS